MGYKMEIKKINEELIDIDDIKMLINQEENKQYKIMRIDVNSPSDRKYRMEITYSKKFKELLLEFQDELLELAESLYIRYKNMIKKKMNLLDSAIFSIVEISIESNVLGNYIVIDVPIIRLIMGSMEKKDEMCLKYVTERFGQIANEMTLSLHRFMDECIRSTGEMTEISEYEFIMYYDGENLLYNDFIQTSKLDYSLEKYNIFRLAGQENLFEKLEDKFLSSHVYKNKSRYYKVRFSYQNREIKGLTCLPLLRPIA